VLQRDGLRVRRRNREVQVLVHVRVEVQFSPLDQLHDGGPREEFAHGADPEERACRVYRRPPVDVRVALALREEVQCLCAVARIERQCPLKPSQGFLPAALPPVDVRVQHLHPTDPLRRLS